MRFGAPPGVASGCPFLVLLFAFFFSLFFFSCPPVASAPAVSGFLYLPAPAALGPSALCFLPPPPPPPTPLCHLPCAPVISGFLWFPASDVLGFGAVQFPCPPPVVFVFFLLWLPVVFVLGLQSFGLPFVFPRPNPLFPFFFLLFATFCSSSPSPPNVLVLEGSILTSLIRCLDLLHITFVWTSFRVVQNQQGFSKTNPRNKHKCEQTKRLFLVADEGPRRLKQNTKNTKKNLYPEIRRCLSRSVPKKRGSQAPGPRLMM